VCRLEDSGVGPSTLALLDRTFVYEFHIPSYVHCLFFLSEHLLTSPSILGPFLFDLVPTVVPLNIEHHCVGLSLARLTLFTLLFLLFPTHSSVVYLFLIVSAQMYKYLCACLAEKQATVAQSSPLVLVCMLGDRAPSSPSPFT